MCKKQEELFAVEEKKKVSLNDLEVLLERVRLFFFFFLFFD
jgi:hypothetical protein